MTTTLDTPLSPADHFQQWPPPDGRNLFELQEGKLVPTLDFLWPACQVPMGKYSASIRPYQRKALFHNLYHFKEGTHYPFRWMFQSPPPPPSSEYSSRFKPASYPAPPNPGPPIDPYSISEADYARNLRNLKHVRDLLNGIQTPPWDYLLGRSKF